MDPDLLQTEREMPRLRRRGRSARQDADAGAVGPAAAQDGQGTWSRPDSTFQPPWPEPAA